MSRRDLGRALRAVQKTTDAELFSTVLRQVLNVSGLEAGVLFISDPRGERSAVAEEGPPTLCAVIKKIAIGGREILFVPRRAYDQRGYFGCRDLMRERGVEAVLALPLVLGEDCFGQLIAVNTRSVRLGAVQEGTLEALAELAAQRLKLQRERARANGLELAGRDERHRFINLWTLLLNGLGRLLKGGNDSAVEREAVAALYARASAASQLTKWLSDRPEVGFLALCREVIESTLHAHGDLRVKLTVWGDDRDIDPSLGPTSIVLAILAELALNSAKHAFFSVGQPAIVLSLIVQEGVAILDYEDNGPGLPEELKPGEGLLVMRQLADQLPYGGLEVSRPGESSFWARLHFRV